MIYVAISKTKVGVFQSLKRLKETYPNEEFNRVSDDRWVSKHYRVFRMEMNTMIINRGLSKIFKKCDFDRWLKDKVKEDG